MFDRRCENVETETGVCGGACRLVRPETSVVRRVYSRAVPTAEHPSCLAFAWLFFFCNTPFEKRQHMVITTDDDASVRSARHHCIRAHKSASGKHVARSVLFYLGAKQILPAFTCRKRLYYSLSRTRPYLLIYPLSVQVQCPHPSPCG